VEQLTGRASEILATVSTTVDPDYKLLSILYAPPGDTSSTSYTDSTTNGTVSTVSSSFTGSVQYTFTLGFVTGSNSLSFGFSKTTGNSDAFTETIADGTSITNDNNSSSPNTVDHKNDLFVLWLNPEVVAGGATYNVQTQSQNGSSEPFDPVYLFASELQTNSSGGTNVTAAHLNKQYDSATGVNDLPGMAHLCASISGSNPNQTYLAQYNSNSCTLTTQCGCVPSDFSNLLALDPLVSSNPSHDATTATNPTTASYDAAGSLCNSPAASDNCRYVPIACSDENCIFSGPSQQGGNHEQTGFTQTDTTQTVLTQTTTTAESVGYGYKVGLGVGPSLSSQDTFTWTDTQSEGKINGQANQIAYSLGSNTVGCSESVLVFEDTVYHTFVLTQAPGNSSCP
jgi:hypothetical protein